MKLYTAVCECGWASKPTKTQAMADRSGAMHRCDSYAKITARRQRGAARRAAVDRTPKPCPHKEAEHRHGTYTCYVSDGCRCDECTLARREWEQDWRKQKAYGRWNGLVDAEPVREHVRRLLAAGLGGKQITRLAGTGGGTWTKLMYGSGGRPPARRVKPSTAHAYLSIPMPTIDDLAAGHKVDPTAAGRRLRALACLGWSISALARRSGLDRQRLDAALHGNRGIVAGTDRAVRKLYDELWGTPAPETTHAERISAARTRSLANAEGWIPPLGWDDIDDPDENPTAQPVEDEYLDEIAVAELVAGRHCITGDAERREAYRILTERGVDMVEIARRIGVTDRTINRWRAAERAA